MNALEVGTEELLEWAQKKMAKQGLPLPTKPKGKDVEFVYPEDPSKLVSIAVGQWMSKFTAWYTYTTSLLGRVASELVPVEAEYKLEINSLRSEVLPGMPGRPAAEVVEAEVLKRHDELGPLYERRLQLMTIKEALEARARIYERGYQAMSRELSRREMEAKIQ